MRTPICLSACLLFASLSFISMVTPVGRTAAQTTYSMAGIWDVASSPINGEIISRKGNTLGFPDREITFEVQDDQHTSFVSRGELGPDVKPLGVWRVQDDYFSSTFQLWCPEVDAPCGTVLMRGHFLDANRIRGTMTVFWDEEDASRPTGFDTWTWSFRGQRLSSGGGD